MTDDVTPDRILKELASIAFADIGDYLQSDEFANSGTVRIRNIDKIAPGKRAAIKKITERATREGLNTDLEMHDKMKALDRLIAILGMDKENVGLPGQASNEERLEPLTESEAAQAYQSMLK